MADTARQVVILEVSRILRGCPKTTTAVQVNRLIREFLDPKLFPCSYGYFRTVVRDIQRERAKVVRWEGRDASQVGPIRRNRGLTGDYPV